METSDLDIQMLKLGGSLITNKAKPHTARLEVINRLAGEIAEARERLHDIKIIIGHGSGSFGHVAGKKYGTRKGVATREEWSGFAEVWREAGSLNRIVLDALAEAGLPVIALPPSASVIAADGQVRTWNLEPLQHALNAGLIPVIFGDVVFDTVRGGTILSTEDLFTYVSILLKPVRILLAGLEKGVWEDFPTCEKLVEKVTPGNIDAIQSSLGESSETDVTGGMIAKVRQSLDLVEKIEGLEVIIFSGEEPGAVAKALQGDYTGTSVLRR
jgi:isopentenyl phosphate kinase